MILRFLRVLGVAFRKVVISTGATETLANASPTITSGSAAPSASEPKGSLYFRTGDTLPGLYRAVDSVGTWVPVDNEATVIADPGTGVAIPVTKSGNIAIVTAAAETNTLAIPTFKGQKLLLYCDTYAVGNRVITSAQAVNQTGNNTLTFGAVRDNIMLEAITVGGALRWQVVHNDGVALSTV